MDELLRVKELNEYSNESKYVWLNQRIRELENRKKCGRKIGQSTETGRLFNCKAVINQGRK